MVGNHVLGATLARGFAADLVVWPLVRSSALFELRYGKALVETSRRPGTIPVFGTNGQCGTHDTSLFSGPGVVCGRKGQGPLGVEWVDSDFWVIDTAYSLRPLRDDVDLKFAYYLVKYVGLNHLKDGTSNPSLNRDTFGSQLFPLPPLPEQRAIAHILGALDDKIELNRKMNATLEAMARALFKSWFVDFDPVQAKAEGRAPSGMGAETAKLFPSKFVESEIGDIPHGWRPGTLAEVAFTLETGKRPNGGATASGVPSIGAESIVGLGIYDYGKVKFIPRPFFDSMKRGRVASRDVLLYKDGGRPGEFEPHVSMFGDGFPFDECAINEHVYRIRANSLATQNYLYFWLSGDISMAEMRVKGTGVAIPGLNSTNAKSLTVLVPSTEVVRAFDVTVEPLVSRILANCCESRTIAKMREALLPRLLSGELPVAGFEHVLEGKK